jgi:hypothetical protein
MLTPPQPIRTTTFQLLQASGLLLHLYYAYLRPFLAPLSARPCRSLHSGLVRIEKCRFSEGSNNRAHFGLEWFVPSQKVRIMQKFELARFELARVDCTVHLGKPAEPWPGPLNKSTLVFAFVQTNFSLGRSLSRKHQDQNGAA